MGGSGAGSAMPVDVALDERELLATFVDTLASGVGWYHLLSYGEEEWERHRREIEAWLGMDLGPCPEGRGGLKAVAKGAIILASWLDLLRRASETLVSDSAAIPLDRSLVPDGLDASLRRPWDDTLLSLGFTEPEGRAFMRAVADRVGGRLRDVGDTARLPHGLALLRLGSLHLVRLGGT